MIDSFQPYLQKQKILILDGAMATELERYGANINDPLWSAKVLVENPELIRQVHLDYLRVGADIITTASYQATFAGFARRGIDHEQAIALMKLSVRLAMEAREMVKETLVLSAAEGERQDNRANSDALIAASIGPYGAFLADGSEYRGDYGLTIAELMNFHRQRMAVLVESGADLLACETIPCLDEGKALLHLLAEFPTARAWLSFSCKDGAHVCQGESFAECVAMANQSPQVLAIGVNCTAPQHVESLVRVAVSVTDKPIVVYPNRGEGYDPVQKCWLPGTEAMSPLETAKRTFSAGARLIGGCCRTTPEDIREIRAALWIIPQMNGIDRH